MVMSRGQDTYPFTYCVVAWYLVVVAKFMLFLG